MVYIFETSGTNQYVYVYIPTFLSLMHVQSDYYYITVKKN